jgi:hypothetical protein
MMAVDYANGVSPHPTLEDRLAVAQAEGLEANLRRAITFIGGIDGAIELQALEVRKRVGDKFSDNRAAHACNIDEAIALCIEADKWISDGTFLIPARLADGLETRHVAPGRWFDMSKGGGTTDNDIAARCALGIDFDVKRPSRISATDEQMAMSVETAERAWRHLTLTAHGREPLIPPECMAYVHSGNGRQIWVALNSIPANAETKQLLASILAGLDGQFSQDIEERDEGGALVRRGRVQVDLSLSDHKRLLPACGTTKKKGAPGIAKRPHRRTAIVTSGHVRALSLDELRQLQARIRDWLGTSTSMQPYVAAMDAAMGIKLAKASKSVGERITNGSSSTSDSPFDKANAIDHQAVAEWLDLFESGGLRCPGCGESQGVDIIDHGLKCMHNRCSGKGKAGFRTNIDLVMEVKRLDAKGAYNALAERFGLEPLHEKKADEEPSEQAPTVDKLRWWTPADIWAPLPPPDYLFDGLLVRGSLALIVAYGSSFKTWLMADGGLAVATGTPWLGRFATVQGGGALVDFESGDYELRRRLHRLAAGRTLALPVERFTFVTMPALNLACDAFYEQLQPIAAEYAFIGIDSLAAGSGGIDENDARFAVSLQRLKALAVASRCVIVVLHHTRKGSPQAREEGDQREMVRGSSAIFNACDVVLQLARTKRGKFLVQQTKARGGKAIDSFFVHVEDVGHTATTVLAADYDASEDADDTADLTGAIEKAKRQIITTLGTTRDLRSKDAIYGRIRGTKSARIAALRELLEAGTVTLHDGIYRLGSEVRQ